MTRWGSSSHANPEKDAEDHEQKVHELRTMMGPISGRDLQYCTDACLRRYLLARNWDVKKAWKMLEDTLKWRSIYKPEEIQWHEVAKEGETGKVYRANFLDREGRSVLIMRPRNQNTASYDNQIRHLVYLIENTFLNSPPGQEQMVWLMDFTGWSLSKAVPIKIAREAAYILQNHYPERLYAAFFYNPPRIFEGFWKIVKYFIDPKTYRKLNFVNPKREESVKHMMTHFDLDALPVEFGGKRKEEYDHVEFSRIMRKDDVKTAAFWGIRREEEPPNTTHS